MRLCGGINATENAINLFLVAKGARKGALLSMYDMVRESAAYTRVLGAAKGTKNEFDKKAHAQILLVRALSADNEWFHAVRRFCEQHGVLVLPTSVHFQLLLTKDGARIEDMAQYIMHGEHHEESFRALARVLEYPQLTHAEFETYVHDGYRSVPGANVVLETSDGSVVSIAGYSGRSARSVSVAKINGAARGLRLADGREVVRCNKVSTPWPASPAAARARP